jgi:hypothetical protein
MSAEDRSRHLTETFISWFALNTGEKAEALSRIYATPPAEAQKPEDRPADSHGVQDGDPGIRSRKIKDIE